MMQHGYCSQDELMYMLRKLLLNIGDLPAQTSHILFNYLVRLKNEEKNTNWQKEPKKGLTAMP